MEMLSSNLRPDEYDLVLTILVQSTVCSKGWGLPGFRAGTKCDTVVCDLMWQVLCV